jgi:hypothetical protein
MSRSRKHALDGAVVVPGAGADAPARGDGPVRARSLIIEQVNVHDDLASAATYAGRDYLRTLRDAVQQTSEAWCYAHRNNAGVRSSIGVKAGLTGKGLDTPIPSARTP